MNEQSQSELDIALSLFINLGIEYVVDDGSYASWSIGGRLIASAVVTIEPALARRWLDTANVGNRNLSPTVVQSYRDQFVQGLWQESPQNVISFDGFGRLLDGQHRLEALARQANAFEFLVQVNWPRESFSVIDQGRIRKAAQLAEGKYTTLRTAAARVVHARSITGGPMAINWEPANLDEELAWLTRWPELDRWTTRVQKIYLDTGINGPTHLAVLAMASRTQHHDAISPWLDGLLSGAGLAERDPRLALRYRYAQPASRKKLNSDRHTALLYVTKAWNAFVMGEGIELQAKAHEGIPNVVGWSDDLAR